MKDKILNFPDAMRLAQLILKHFDTVSIKEMTGEQFGYALFDKIEEEEMLQVGKLFLGEEYLKVSPRELIQTCVRGMIKNDILILLEKYQDVGLGK